MIRRQLIYCIAWALILKDIVHRKNLITMAYQWLGLYSFVNLIGKESDE